MKIKKTALTRLDTGTGVTIGGKHVLRHALTRVRGVPVTGSSLRIQRQYCVSDNSPYGVTIP